MEIGFLIEGVEYSSIGGEVGQDVTSLTYDSRTVESGACFFAVVGTLSDGHDYINVAIERGARVIVCQRIPAQERLAEGVCYVVVASTEVAMAHFAKRFYGDPSREINLVGITGTNGKTTTATLLADLFERLGYATGLISTVTYRIAGAHHTSTHTTPDTIRLNAMLREMVDAGCHYCFMEVSSHSMVQHRVEGLKFRGAIFTNLTHDHLDYHGTFMEYLRAKKSLFDTLPKESFALVNCDDRNGEVMLQNCSAKQLSYSLMRVAPLRARVVEMHFDGMLLNIDGSDIWVQILGRFNAYNLLAAYGAARELGVAKDDILVAMSSLGAVSGRFEHFTAPENRTIIIDYAHTPDALESVLRTIEQIRMEVGGEIITVCGCGGDRDRSKRAEMARIAVEGSSTAIFTSDNPRGESPEAILADMVEGVKGCATTSHRWLKISDRREAIRTAVMLSKGGDIILIAGKGHEKYQIIAGVKHHFDDHEEAHNAITECLN